MSSNEIKAGTYEFFDTTAIQIIKRSAIDTVIVNGNDAQNVQRALTQKIGTRIVSQG